MSVLVFSVLCWCVEVVCIGTDRTVLVYTNVCRECVHSHGGVCECTLVVPQLLVWCVMCECSV